MSVCVGWMGGIEFVYAAVFLPEVQVGRRRRDAHIFLLLEGFCAHCPLILEGRESLYHTRTELWQC